MRAAFPFVRTIESYFQPAVATVARQRSVIVSGSRRWKDVDRIERALKRLEPPDAWTVVHGNCRGADKIAGEAARRLGMNVRAHPADWKTHGRKAGPIRNREMLREHPEATRVFVFHDDLTNSRGTMDMLKAIGAYHKRLGYEKLHVEINPPR